MPPLPQIGDLIKFRKPHGVYIGEVTRIHENRGFDVTYTKIDKEKIQFLTTIESYKIVSKNHYYLDKFVTKLFWIIVILICGSFLLAVHSNWLYSCQTIEFKYGWLFGQSSFVRYNCDDYFKVNYLLFSIRLSTKIFI